MVIKRYTHFIPTNSAADWATGEDWGSGGGVVVVVVCVWGGDEAISKSHAHTCMCPF